MSRFILAICAAVILFVPSPSAAAETAVEALLPESCAPGWVAEGKVSAYTRENLYRYIDGEAEIYLPYGFERAATVVFAKPGDSDNGLVANIFKMGSLLDAYGIYGNYRSPEAEQVSIGGEGFVEESQLMFFQDRYFVQIMASGTISQERPLFLACAAAISRNLPGGSARPRELEVLKVPGLVPLTEKYYPEGLLGYGFFGRGLTAEVKLKGVRVKAVFVLGDSDDAVRGLFDAYSRYLKESKATPRISSDKRGRNLRAIDPLYKSVLLQQSGRYAVGVTGLADPGDGDELVDRLLERLPRQ